MTVSLTSGIISFHVLLPRCNTVLLACLCLGWLLPVPSRADSLRAGTAKVDITPAAGVLLWGFAARQTPATGTLDPLYARVLVLEAGEARIAMVTLDLGRTVGSASLERLRTLARQSGVSYVFVAASHTHAGPVILDEYPSGQTPFWEDSAIQKIAGAIKAACGHLQDARIGTGSGSAWIGHNRLRPNPDGTVTFLERNPTQVPTAPFDPTVTVLRVDGADGVPIAILVNYACHPVIFGGDLTEFSADYPAIMTKTVEAAFDGKPLCLFLQGAAGDINPYYAVTPWKEDAVGRRQWSGQTLGEAAARIAKTIQTTTDSHPSLDFSEDRLPFALRWEPEKFRKGLLSMWGPKAFEIFAPPIQPVMQLPVATILINKRVAFLGIPGEAFVDFQIDWRARCPVKDAFFVGYANGYYGYFPTIPKATMKAYGASAATTWVEPGAAEEMVNHALVMIYKHLGSLLDAPW